MAEGYSRASTYNRRTSTKTLLTAALIALAVPAFAADAPVGKVLSEEGKVFHNTNGTVVRKALKSGEKIDRHNHEGEDIIFNVMSGKITVTLNDGEVHELNAGDTLVFNGKNYISAVAGADTVVVITLVKE